MTDSRSEAYISAESISQIKADLKRMPEIAFLIRENVLNDETILSKIITLTGVWLNSSREVSFDTYVANSFGTDMRNLAKKINSDAFRKIMRLGVQLPENVLSEAREVPKKIAKLKEQFPENIEQFPSSYTEYLNALASLLANDEIKLLIESGCIRPTKVGDDYYNSDFDLELTKANILSLMQTPEVIEKIAKHKLRTTYRLGAAEGGLQARTIADVGYCIGLFLNNRDGARLAGVNRAAAATARAEEKVLKMG